MNKSVDMEYEASRLETGLVLAHTPYAKVVYRLCGKGSTQSDDSLPSTARDHQSGPS